jgi:hypothetical protein
LGIGLPLDSGWDVSALSSDEIEVLQALAGTRRAPSLVLSTATSSS